ncbi:uncharacterized protein LOC100877956 [Megachile rotundata]|uniref:uncharacterized protein LOC100877956 n=1 Tax=Megachile rotundata TaxID=143995 RepID=UPI000258E148|nr:PREDICTED: uncharacterized protein LOC100877956 [Megachile rotundata]
MSRQDILHFLCLMFLANSCVDYSSCAYYKQEEYSLDSEKFCHLLRKTTTTEIKDSAIIVTSKHMFNPWTEGRKNIHCKFIIKTAKGDGLFGVIQKMSFRRNGTQCLDYVQFMRKDHHKTEKFCGFLDRSKVKYYVVPEPENSMYSSEPPPSARTYAEFDPSGYKSGAELETEIFVSNEKLQEGESLSLSIAYTPFKNCSKVDLREYTPIFRGGCLLNEYFCDGIYNCVPGVCLLRADEDNCPNNPNEIMSTGTGTKVTIGAVTTVILCFIIFVMCLWICKRSQKLYWSVDYADPNAARVPGQNGATLPHEAERTANPTVPTAPILEVAVPSSVNNKDLPPSYDSLFPEQSNPVRS